MHHRFRKWFQYSFRHQNTTGNDRNNNASPAVNYNRSSYDDDDSLQLGLPRAAEARVYQVVDFAMSQLHVKLAELVDDVDSMFDISAAVREGCLTAALTVAKAVVATSASSVKRDVDRAGGRIADAIDYATVAALSTLPPGNALDVAIAAANTITEVAYHIALSKTRPLPRNTAATFASVAHDQVGRMAGRVTIGKYPLGPISRLSLIGRLRSSLISYLP